MKLITQLRLGGNRGLIGALPSQWSAFDSIMSLCLTQAGLSGTLPREWSACQGLKYLWLGRQMFSGTLPREWSALSRLNLLNLESNFLTGTLPPEWRSIPLTSLYLQNNWLAGTIPNGLCQRASETASPDESILDLQLNFFSFASDAHNGNAIAYNCLPGTPSQHMCPALWWPLAMAGIMVAVVGASVALWAGLTGWGCSVRHTLFAAGQLRSCRLWHQHYPSGCKFLLMLAVLTSIGQRLYILSPWFQRVLLEELIRRFRTPGSNSGQITKLIGGTLASSLPVGPVVILLLAFVVRAARTLAVKPEWLPDGPAARAWTLVASEDILRDNLRAIRVDQMILLGVFITGAVLLITFSYTFLPELTQVREIGSSVYNNVDTRVIVVDRAGAAMLYVSYMTAFYSVAAAVTIPEAIVSSSAAIREGVRVASRSQKSGRYLRQLGWLRWAVVQAGVSLAIYIFNAIRSFSSLITSTKAGPHGKPEQPAATDLSLVILVALQVLLAAGWNFASWGSSILRFPVLWFSSRQLSQVLPTAAAELSGTGTATLPTASHIASSYGATAATGTAIGAHYADGEDCGPPPSDIEAAAHGETLGVTNSDGAKLLCRLPAPLNAWGGCQGKAQDDGASPQHRRPLWQRLLQPQVGLIGRTRAQSTALLLVIALNMIHMEGGSTQIKALTWVVWLASSLTMAWAVAVRDRPAGFNDIHGSEAFGMVVLASDLAAALGLDLADPDSSQTHCAPMSGPQGEEEEEPQVSSCCEGHPAGCPECQLLLRRFPATLFRMEETMCVSYRWQKEVRAVVRPPGHSSVAPCSGVRNKVVGINMSRWQRQQLHAAINSSPCTYVWLDVLSIPAALEPEQGTSLWQTSDKLMTRMMAVYAAAASTLVLLSKEEDGGRYFQRAWTLQEYCGARALQVVPQASSAPVHPGPRSQHTSSSSSLMSMLSVFAQRLDASEPEEAERFTDLRRLVRRSMANAMPFWIRLLRSECQMANAIEQVEERATIFASVAGKVNCSRPVDLVRALLPMLLNSSVQDMAELRQLVREALKVCQPGSPAARGLEKARRLVEQEVSSWSFSGVRQSRGELITCPGEDGMEELGRQFTTCPTASVHVD